jgi:hypothetical protein
LFSFRDKTVDLASKWRVFYYRIEVTKSTGEKGYSPVDYLGVKPDIEALYMMKQQWLQLRVQNGSPALIFPRRTSGPKCPECYDPVTKRSVDSDCTFCFNQKYSGGYLPPIPTWIMFSSSRKLRQVAQVHETSPNSKVIDMTGYPLVVMNWLIVDATNRRFRVQSVENHEKRLFVFRQIVTAEEIARTDIVYRLPVDASLFPNLRRPDGEFWPLSVDMGHLQVPTPEGPPRG